MKILIYYNWLSKYNNVTGWCLAIHIKSFMQGALGGYLRMLGLYRVWKGWWVPFPRRTPVSLSISQPCWQWKNTYFLQVKVITAGIWEYYNWQDFHIAARVWKGNYKLTMQGMILTLARLDADWAASCLNSVPWCPLLK